MPISTIAVTPARNTRTGDTTNIEIGVEGKQVSIEIWPPHQGVLRLAVTPDQAVGIAQNLKSAAATASKNRR